MKFGLALHTRFINHKQNQDDLDEIQQLNENGFTTCLLLSYACSLCWFFKLENKVYTDSIEADKKLFTRECDEG